MKCECAIASQVVLCVGKKLWIVRLMCFKAHASWIAHYTWVSILFDTFKIKLAFYYLYFKVILLMNER